METHTVPPVRVQYAADTSFNPTPALLTVPQTMARLNCAKSKLYELFLSGRLPRVKFGGRTLVPVEAIDRLLTELVSAAEADAAARRAGGAA